MSELTLAEHAATTKDMVAHLATLTALASEANRVIELGLRTGVSTWALLDGLPEHGRLWSVDIDADCKVPERVAFDPRWEFVVGGSTWDSTWAKLPDGCELVFIDASHEYHLTCDELRFADRLNAGRIALHDWNLPDVHDAVVGFLDRHPRWKLERLEPSDCCGLVVLRRV